MNTDRRRWLALPEQSPKKWKSNFRKHGVDPSMYKEIIDGEVFDVLHAIENHSEAAVHHGMGVEYLKAIKKVIDKELREKNGIAGNKAWR